MASSSGNGDENGANDGGTGVDLLKVLRALARAISSVTTSVERLEASNAEIQHRVEELERERG